MKRSTWLKLHFGVVATFVIFLFMRWFFPALGTFLLFCYLPSKDSIEDWDG